MQNSRPHIFNIPLSCSFWDTLADIYLKKYEKNELMLADVLFLLPNRRACQSLVNAFIRKQGLKPAILPQITPITEIDDDELFFNGFSMGTFFEEEKKTISREKRLFLFTRLIMSKPADFGLRQISLAQALSLAVDLSNLIDTTYNQGLSFDKLQDLVPEKYATHWQETLKLLKIITEYWPHILAEYEAVDSVAHKNRLLNLQALLWKQKGTAKNIVAAGITASFPAVVSLLESIMQLPNGEIYFSGIDHLADDAYWQAIDENHPQFELKTLLALLELKRTDIPNIIPSVDTAREHLISETMRPAKVSDTWRYLAGKIDVAQATKNIRLITCDTQRDEAIAIALKMRQILTMPEKTAALITYDRGLARRVASELERFGIKIDDSAGLPLHLSPIGIFLALIAEAAANLDSEIKLVSLLKHPFSLFNCQAADFRKKVYDYELNLRQTNTDLTEENLAFITQIKKALLDFSNKILSTKISFRDLLEQHIQTAELIASSAEHQGKFYLWRGDAGKCAAKFVTKLLEAADTLGEINGSDYLPLISELMGLESVRASYGTHPRLSILGPIEARLCHFDYVILGEVNEGIWPKPAQADMWMSRPMKKDFGLSLPEKNIGILGADLCGFLAAENVVITRAERVDGAPMRKSRWLLRLETVLKALGSTIEVLKSDVFYHLAHLIDTPSCYLPIKPPAPTPPVDARPRKLSASGVDLLVQDPYSVFAKYILRLYPLDNLDMVLDQRNYGTLIHGIIEEFNNTYPAEIPENSLEILCQIGRRHFQEMAIDKELEAFWLPKFEKTAQWIIEQEKAYRAEVKKVHNEISGEITYHLPAGDFTFTAKADRVDELKDGRLNIIDYKTGKIPTQKQIMSGHALQLSLEGLIATKGHFAQMQNPALNKLIYWQLGKTKFEYAPADDDILVKTEEFLLKLISTFDFETTPYHSRPIPKFIPKNKDYEHLARIKEWSVQEESDGED